MLCKEWKYVTTLSDCNFLNTYNCLVPAGVTGFGENAWMSYKHKWSHSDSPGEMNITNSRDFVSHLPISLTLGKYQSVNNLEQDQYQEICLVVTHTRECERMSIIGELLFYELATTIISWLDMELKDLLCFRIMIISVIGIIIGFPDHNHCYKSM